LSTSPLSKKGCKAVADRVGGIRSATLPVPEEGGIDLSMAAVALFGVIFVDHPVEGREAAEEPYTDKVFNGFDIGVKIHQRENFLDFADVIEDVPHC
jgi:hypothetical protein